MPPPNPQPLEHEASFQLLFDNNPLPMWIYDTQSLAILAVNVAATRRYGYCRKDFLTKTTKDLRHPEELDTHDVARSIPVGMSLTTCERHLHQNGSSIDVELTWSRIHFSAHDAVFVMAHDITQRKAAEARIGEQASLLNLARDAIIATDFNDRIRLWNQGAERLYGWTEKETIGKPAGQILGGDPEMLALAKETLLETGEWSGELVQKTREGNRVVVASRLTLVRNEEGAPKTVLIINTDITERKSLESQFLRAQRLESIGALASGIAHDLNNILTPIGMSASLLRREIGNDPKAEQLLSAIEVSAARGAEIVKQVLTFSRGADGEKALLQPRHLVVEIVKIASQTFPRNISIRTAFPKDLWTLYGDATQLHQVLLNLCVNARDAMAPDGGTITIGAENVSLDARRTAIDPEAKPGPHVVLTITDTGPGISPDVIQKIFDPFFTTKEQGKGTGLGLSTVVGIVKGHGGFITVESQPCEGTTFRIALPAQTAADNAVAGHEKNPAPRGNGELILVVDDEPSIREAASSTLTNAGYRVFTAEDGSDALALYSQRKKEIALVFTDLVMELMDGIALVRAMQRVEPNVRVIVSSGQNGPDQRAAFESAGISTFLDKPFTAEELLRLVHAILHPEDRADCLESRNKSSATADPDKELRRNEKAHAFDDLEIDFEPVTR